MPTIQVTLQLDLSPATAALLKAGHGPTMLEAMARISVHTYGAPNREDVLAIEAGYLALDRLAIIAANTQIVEDCAAIGERIDRMEGERNE